MEPCLLTDKSRLQEIYDLRVAAWENSERSQSINSSVLPTGWAEEIDKEAYHFVIFDQDDRIAASARVSLHQNISELPYPSAFEIFDLPIHRPFAFYSRLVVSPDYRSSFFLKKLDLIRIQFLKQNQIPFAIATCTEKRLKSIQTLGFEILGKTSIQNPFTSVETALILYLGNIK
jgi:hypothetical protein